MLRYKGRVGVPILIISDIILLQRLMDLDIQFILVAPRCIIDSIRSIGWKE